MSTKIFNGYKIPSMTLPELFNFMFEFRDRVRPVLTRLILQRTAEICAGVINAAALDLPTPFLDNDRTIQAIMNNRTKIAPWWFANSYLTHKQDEIERTHIRDPQNDFSCNLTIHLIPGGNSYKLLVLLFTEQKEFEKLWNLTPGVEHYEYFNNTDRPKEISKEEWKVRELDWESALQAGVPALAGLQFDTCANKPMFGTFNNILEYIPPVKERAKNLAVDEVFRHFCRTKYAKLDSYQLVSAMRDFKDYLKTSKGKSSVNERASVIAVFLPEITTEILTREVTVKIPEKPVA